MSLRRFVFILSVLLVVSACGEDAAEQPVTSSVNQAPAQSAQEQTDNSTGSVAQTSAGGVKVIILPENPTGNDCLRVQISGRPGSLVISWKVNGSLAQSGTEASFCSDEIVRDDTVEVVVGTIDQGATAMTTILNSLPVVVDIESTPDEIYAGTDVTVNPVAEDRDGDDVSFTYQWLVNGEAVEDLTEETIPGAMFTKGDTIQVQIIPNDFFDDGPLYESYAMPIPNAAPRITSQPPEEITSLDYEYRVVVEDPDDTVFTYRLDEAPEGMMIDENSGVLKWSLVEAKPGEHTIAIIAADSEGAESAQEYTLTLSPAE